MISVVRQADGFVSQNMLNPILPSIRLPGAQCPVGQKIVLRNGMRADDHLQTKLGRNEITEGVQPRTGWIADDQTRRQMDDIDTVLFHLGRGVLNVPAGATSASGESHKLYLLVRVEGKGAFSIVQGAQTLAPGTSVITMTNDDSDLLHVFAPCIFGSVSVNDQGLSQTPAPRIVPRRSKDVNDPARDFRHARTQDKRTIAVPSQHRPRNKPAWTVM